MQRELKNTRHVMEVPNSYDIVRGIKESTGYIEFEKIVKLPAERRLNISVRSLSNFSLSANIQDTDESICLNLNIFKFRVTFELYSVAGVRDDVLLHTMDDFEGDQFIDSSEKDELEKPKEVKNRIANVWQKIEESNKEIDPLDELTQLSQELNLYDK